MPNQEILSETRELRREVREVRLELGKNKGVVRRLRVLTIVAAILLVFMGYQVYENQNAAVVQCRNANESREFQYKAWLYVLGQELTDHSERQNNVEAQMAENILPIMKKGWRARDCENLDTPYPIKMPPTPDNVPNELLWGTP